MPQIPGTVLVSHAGWRLARPDGDYERMVLPQDCQGDLIVEEYLSGDRVRLECNGCPFEITTDAPRPGRVDDRTQSRGGYATNEAGF